MAQNIAGQIDHTLLKPIATSQDFERLGQEACEFGFFSVCVPPCWVKKMASLLKNQTPKVCTVIGFPLGYSVTAAKIQEVQFAIEDGADELDMVMNLSALKMADYNAVENDISGVVTAGMGKIIKVILETGHLNESEIETACKISQAAGAHFVKTSTGFGPRGASLKDVQIMKKTFGSSLGIKASGGISNYEQALTFIEAGATRLGTSRSCQIMNSIARSDNESSSRGNY